MRLPTNGDYEICSVSGFSQQQWIEHFRSHPSQSKAKATVFRNYMNAPTTKLSSFWSRVMQGLRGYDCTSKCR